MLQREQYFSFLLDCWQQLFRNKFMRNHKNVSDQEREIVRFSWIFFWGEGRYILRQKIWKQKGELQFNFQLLNYLKTRGGKMREGLKLRNNADMSGGNKRRKQIEDYVIFQMNRDFIQRTCSFFRLPNKYISNLSYILHYHWHNTIQSDLRIRFLSLLGLESFL